MKKTATKTAPTKKAAEEDDGLGKMKACIVCKTKAEFKKGKFQPVELNRDGICAKCVEKTLKDKALAKKIEEEVPKPKSKTPPTAPSKNILPDKPTAKARERVKPTCPTCGKIVDAPWEELEQIAAEADCAVGAMDFYHDDCDVVAPDEEPEEAPAPKSRKHKTAVHEVSDDLDF